MKRIAIGTDLGCTNIKAVLIDEAGTVLHQERRETREQDDQHWKASVDTLIKDLKKHAAKKVDSIGLCAPGLANPALTSSSETSRPSVVKA